jgi:hypothetical protein
MIFPPQRTISYLNDLKSLDGEFLGFWRRHRQKSNETLVDLCLVLGVAFGKILEQVARLGLSFFEPGSGQTLGYRPNTIALAYYLLVLAPRVGNHFEDAQCLFLVLV